MPNTTQVEPKVNLTNGSYTYLIATGIASTLIFDVVLFIIGLVTDGPKYIQGDLAIILSISVVTLIMTFSEFILTVIISLILNPADTIGDRVKLVLILFLPLIIVTPIAVVLIGGVTTLLVPNVIYLIFTIILLVALNRRYSRALAAQAKNKGKRQR
jgi:hypothetical protein